MDSGLVISSPQACSVTTGGNHWPSSKHSTKNIYYTSSCAATASQQKRRTQIKYNVLMLQQPSLNHRYKSFEAVSTYQDCNKKYVLNAVPEQSFDSEPHASAPQNNLDLLKKFLIVLNKFCYPYALISITLCTISSSLLTVEKLSDISMLFFIGVLQAVVPQLFIAVYVCAINQLSDFEIDKINKPYLPLASGQLSYTNVVIIAASFLTLGFGLSWIIGSWSLIWNVVLTSSMWAIYSINVPLLRWKRHPLLALICQISVIAFVIPITSFLHMQTFVLKRPIVFPRSLMFVVLIMNFFAVCTALAKDIPDVEGDKLYGIDTFPIRLGQKRVFWICVFLLEMAFGVGLLAGASSSYLSIKIITGLGHVALASILWYQAKSIDISSKASTGSFYILIWQLLYATYFLMALIR